MLMLIHNHEKESETKGVADLPPVSRMTKAGEESAASHSVSSLVSYQNITRHTNRLIVAVY